VPAVAEAGSGDTWFARTEMPGGLTHLTEPFVHEYLRANIWHLRGRDADLLVDTGMGLCPLAPLIPVGGKPLIVVATHIHLDHVGGLHEFAVRFGPHRSAGAFASMALDSTYESALRDLTVPVTRLPEPGWLASNYRLTPAPLTRTLQEGDLVDLGDRRFRVVELPGHSPDSIGLFDEREGLFFAGDAIYDDELIDNLPDSDIAAYLQTMERLRHLPVRIAHGGHGPSFDRARLIEIANGYLTSRGA